MDFIKSHTYVFQCTETPDAGKTNAKKFMYSSALSANRKLNHNPGKEEQTGLCYTVSTSFGCTIR